MGLFTLMGAVLTEDESNSSGKQCETTTIEKSRYLGLPICVMWVFKGIEDNDVCEFVYFYRAINTSYYQNKL